MITQRQSLLQSLADHYNRAAVVAQQTDSAEIAFFAGLAPRTRPLRVLDMGCAEGALAVALARLGCTVTAADIAPAFLQQTTERASREGVRVRTVELDIEKSVAPLGGETFDVIYLMDVLEHLRAPASGCANLREALAPGGVAYVHTPNCCALSRVLHYLLHPRRRFDYFRPEMLGDLHLELFDQMTLEKTMNLVGLRVERVIPTRLTPPVIHRLGAWPRLGRALAAWFPHLADTLLFACVRAEPVDIDAAIAYWSGKQ
jgi:2-polyprenyl-3-methyl-5-hydroxy-6-metoxy-1,4-benzoquinol methylase